MNRTHVFMLLLVLVSACKKSNAQDAKNPKDDKDAQAVVDDADERVDIPNNVLGSYLACAVRKEANDKDLETEYGCRLSDSETNNKLDLQDKVSQLAWTSNLDSGVTIVLTDAASPYHAFYRIKGSSVDTIRETTNKLEVVANWRLTSGTLVPVKRDKIGNVLRPDVELETFQVPIDRPQVIKPD